MEKKQKRGLWDAVTSLRDFAIITYKVRLDILRSLVDERFSIKTITGDDGEQWGLVSVVPFMDIDFRFKRFPFWKHRFGQTNYRVYVEDMQTGEDVVWFLGTVLDSWTVHVPRRWWKLPWHGGRTAFDCEYDEAAGRYTKYEMKSSSEWAPSEVVLNDSGVKVGRLEGFDVLQEGRRVLTHPSKGYFYRRDRQLGGYSIYHDWLDLTVGGIEKAEFGLLARLGLVKLGDLSQVHSVLMQRETEFEIYLPPLKFSCKFLSHFDVKK